MAYYDLSQYERAIGNYDEAPGPLWSAGTVAPTSVGWAWSAPLTFPEAGTRIVLNADHPAQMRVEVSDEMLGLLPGYPGPSSGVPLPDGGLNAVVSWPSRGQSAPARKSVKLKLNLQ